jgi:hypothetical protein
VMGVSLAEECDQKARVNENAFHTRSRSNSASSSS